MNASSNPSSTQSPTARVGSKLLERFVDTDALFVRSPKEAVPQKVSNIPLVRFQQLEQEIRHAPAVPDPYTELGQIYIQQERWADARRVLDAGVQFCPESEAIVTMREELILHQSNQLVEQARNRLSQQPDAEGKYALEQAEISHANERIRICRDRYARHPDQQEILIHWAIGLRQLGRYEDALALLIQAASVPELRARASLQLGMCYQTLSKPLEALSAFRKAALFRAPAPEIKIRNRALELAMELSEDLQLIDSARFYAKEWLRHADTDQQPIIEEHIRRLASLEF